MLKKYSRYVILALIQGIVLISLLSYLMTKITEHPAMINEFKFGVHGIANMAVCARVILYLLVFAGWERLINCSAKQKNAQSKNIDRKAKYIFLIVAIAFEVLFAFGGGSL